MSETSNKEAKTIHRLLEMGFATDSDELIFFTDGITDATNEVNNSFGKERLLKSAMRNVLRPLSTQIDCIISDVKTFSANVPQNDDITLIILEKK